MSVDKKLVGGIVIVVAVIVFMLTMIKLLTGHPVLTIFILVSIVAAIAGIFILKE